MFKTKIAAAIIGTIMFNINIAVISAIGALVLVWLVTNFMMDITEE